MNGDLYLISNGELSALLPHVQAVARDAGALILQFYKAAQKPHIKNDGSPVTEADVRSSALIETRLSQLTPGIAVVSEENNTNVRADSLYWTVDPLDGTKEFIAKTDGFAVKIALMDHNEPVLAVVYVPAYYNALYSGLRDGLATRQTGGNPPQFLSVRENTKWDLHVLFNASHSDPVLYDVQRKRFLARNVALPRKPSTYPGLPRNLRVAEGLSDFHLATGIDPALNSSGYIWDNAPDWLILTNAGGTMRRLSDGAPLTFGEPRELMPSYIAIGDKKLGKKLFPEP